MAGALLGLVPALQRTRPDVAAAALRSENPGSGQPGQLRWRNALVVTQLTISLVLQVGAGLFLRSSQRVQSVDPGFGREPTALMTFLTPATPFAPDEARVYTRHLLDRFRALPGVEAVGTISNLHLNPLSQSSSDLNVDGFEPPAGREIDADRPGPGCGLRQVGRLTRDDFRHGERLQWAPEGGA